MHDALHNILSTTPRFKIFYPVFYLFDFMHVMILIFNCMYKCKYLLYDGYVNDA